MRRLTTSLAITTTLLWAGIAAAQDDTDDDDTEVEAGAELTVDTDGDGVPDAAAGAEVGAATGEEVPAAVVAGFTAETWPRRNVDRPTTLGKGMIEIQAEVGIGLSTDLVGQPIGIHPDVYYGVSDDLTLGLTHAQGICFNGEVDLGAAGTLDLCGSGVYDDVGVDALFKLHRKGKLDVAAHGGVDIAAFDPFIMALRAGTLVYYLATPDLLITADPYLVVGLTERDAGNKEAINIPLYVTYQVTPELSPWIRTGVGGPFSDFGENYLVPVGVGALYSLNQTMDVGGEFSFPAIIAGTAEGEEAPGADARQLEIFFNYRM